MPQSVTNWLVGSIVPNFWHMILSPFDRNERPIFQRGHRPKINVWQPYGRWPKYSVFDAALSIRVCANCPPALMWPFAGSHENVWPVLRFLRTDSCVLGTACYMRFCADLYGVERRAWQEWINPLKICQDETNQFIFFYDKKVIV